jgi:D-glycero-D-manno-heptose 1,7-bisphosphate phosphatase
VTHDGPAVLLDRDGVITRRRDDYVTSPDEVEVLPGSAEAIARLCAAGYRVAVVTNQSAVGRGLMTMDTLETIHRGLDAVIRAAGGEISEYLVCPHLPDAGCDCRKPRPGLLLEAGRRLGVDLDSTFMVGDQPSDVIAALAAGCRPILLEENTAGLAAAVDLILAGPDQGA